MQDIYEITQDHKPTISEAELSDEAVMQEVLRLKQELKNEVVILGHHYQQDDVVSVADFKGDSLELARAAATRTEPYIIFCGVHFMAETADMLTKEDQKVILPDLNAGCSMADMAQEKEIQKAWEFIKSATNDKIVPITYINCAATLKSFVGEHGGAICTSTNAEKVISWGLKQGEKLLFFPDQHLGRNTCYKLGIPLDEMVVYNPNYQNGGLTAQDIQKAKVILWYGFCSVHQGFKLEHIKAIKQKSPETIVLVHPECNFEVTQGADLAGSTSYIINTVKNAAPGTSFAIGTEINLVNRLAQEYPHIKIQSLSPYQCLCTTMYRVRPRWLLASLRSIRDKNPINVISVGEEIKNNSLKALARMLEIS